MATDDMPNGSMVNVKCDSSTANDLAATQKAILLLEEAFLDAVKQLAPQQRAVLLEKMRKTVEISSASTTNNENCNTDTNTNTNINTNKDKDKDKNKDKNKEKEKKGSNDNSNIEVAASSGDTAADRGIAVASRVQDLGFVEFTAGLINGTFDAIVGATLKQMEGYAQLVADLSKTISQFQAENISDAHITQYLAERYPDGRGGTVVRSDFTFTDIPQDTARGVSAQSPADQLQAIADNLNLATQGLEAAQRLNLTVATNATAFTDEQVRQVRKAIGLLLATNQLNILRTMAREGMARIVIDEGEILTRLTFSISTTQQQQQQRQNFNQNLNQATMSGGAGALWWRVSGSVTNTNLNVNAVNESSFDSTTMNTEMIGQVRLKFRTETFASVDVPKTPEPTPKP